MNLIYLAYILGLALIAAGLLLILAGWELWKDHELAKHEQESTQRRVLETAHRTPSPMHERAAQGFRRKAS